MPELPEVETIVRSLKGVLPGVRVRAVEVLRSDLVLPDARRFREGLGGSVLLSVRRRGKKVVLDLDDRRVLVMALGMTGRVLLSSEGGGPPPRGRHLGVRILLDAPFVLDYEDTRRFGRLTLLPSDEWRRYSRALGPEPLSRALTAERFTRALARSRAPIRSWLLDQRRVAGVGNIYAAEALFKAGVHPARPAGSLSPEEAQSLLRALRSVLRKAIRAGGTTFRDYRTAGGKEGNYQRSLAVYGREALPCRVCETPVQRFRLSNRSAFYCPRCQPSDPPS